MNRYIYTIALLSLILVGSCSKDLGNYVYKDINELTITNVNPDYTVRTGLDTLRIKPEVSATLDSISDTSRYQHLWILQVGANLRDTIGRSSNLEYPINLNPGEFRMYYRMKDKETGVTWVADTKIIVTTAFSRGLLIMGEDEQGNAEAEMLSMLTDTVHVTNILSKSGLPTLTQPISFFHTGPSDTYTQLWVLTGTGSYMLDRAKLTSIPNNTLDKSLFASDALDQSTLFPVIVGPQVRTAAGLNSGSLYRALITKGGDLFTAMPLIGGRYYNNPVNRLASQQDVRLPAAPYLLYPIGSMSTVMWYDTKNNQFLTFTGFGSATSSLVNTDLPNAIFPWKQPEGRTLVYAENTRNSDGGSTNGNSFAIMKDSDNTFVVYKFYANGTSPAKRAVYTISAIAKEFDKASSYAFSSNRSVIFYSVGSKLYAYDYNPGYEKFYEINSIGTDEISMIKFDTQVDYVTNSLYVATYNPATKGTLRRYRVGTDPNTVELLLQPNSTWTNMVKIKDVNWRALN